MAPPWRFASSPALAALLVAAGLRACGAAVVVENGTLTYHSLPDLPADFGPRLPAGGVVGTLVLARPRDACSPLTPPVDVPRGVRWVALTRRSPAHSKGACTFDVKVRHAAAAGAAAAIVADDGDGPLVIMSAARGAPDPGVPAVFVSRVSGDALAAAAAAGPVRVRLTPLADAVWVSVFLASLAGALALAAVVATLQFVADRHARGAGAAGTPPALGYALLGGEGGGMTEEQLRSLPVVVHDADDPSRRGGGRRDRAPARPASARGASPPASDGDGSPLGTKGGGTLRTCAVCIEDYTDGDKLRVLPCRHRFHLECIDQWLSARKPLCPVCKWDALVPFSGLGGVCGPAHDLEAGGASAGEDGEGTTAAPARLGWLWGRGRRREGGGGGGGADAAPAPAPTPPLPAHPTLARAVPGPGRPSADAASSHSATPLNFPGMHWEARRGAGAGE